MGNCFSDDKGDSSPPPKSNNQHKPGSGKRGSTATGARVEMSWAVVERQTRLPKNADVKKYEQSKDPADYMCEKSQPDPANEEQATLMAQCHGYIPWVRLPGQINDQRINIENGKKTAFLLLDHCDSVQVDDCVDCLFWIGPTTGSVFVRGCKNCKFVIACGQLRLRDVKHSDFSLFCQSRPVLESSSSIRIGPYITTGYPELKHQFAKSRLSVFNNKYTMVHDFTPNSKNFEFLTNEEATALCPRLSSFSGSLAAEHVFPDEEELLSENPVVPLTHGVQVHNLPHMFAVLFSPGFVLEAFEFVNILDQATRADPTQILLLSTLEQVFSRDSISAIEGAGHTLKSAEAETLLSGGPTIGISFAASSADPDIWRTFVSSASTEKSVVVLKSGPAASVASFCEAVFEKIPLMGMGFGSAM